jgi:hypothetical protein
MECKNHPGVAAVARCAGCAEAFCANCLVDIGGRQYCGSCKTMEAGAAGSMPEEATIPCKEASEALTYSIVGLFCFGFILEPIALVKAFKAKQMIAENPRLAGSGKVTAAIIIGIVGLVLWVVGLIARFSQQMPHH